LQQRFELVFILQTERRVQITVESWQQGVQVVCGEGIQHGQRNQRVHLTLRLTRSNLWLLNLLALLLLSRQCRWRQLLLLLGLLLLLLLLLLLRLSWQVDLLLLLLEIVLHLVARELLETALGGRVHRLIDSGQWPPGVGCRLIVIRWRSCRYVVSGWHMLSRQFAGSGGSRCRDWRHHLWLLLLLLCLMIVHQRAVHRMVAGGGRECGSQRRGSAHELLLGRRLRHGQAH